MVPHKKGYLDFFYPGWGEDDFIPCEMCGRRACDIHHIFARGMGGDPQKKRETPDNWMALCRPCHDKAEDTPTKSEEYKKIINCHKIFMEWKNLESQI